jgi:hypothetical protein
MRSQRPPPHRQPTRPQPATPACRNSSTRRVTTPHISKLFPLVADNDAPTEKLAADIVVSQRRQQGAEHPCRQAVNLLPGKRAAPDQTDPADVLVHQLERLKAQRPGQGRASLQSPQAAARTGQSAYQGLKKNMAQLFTLFAPSNLWMVRSSAVGRASMRSPAKSQKSQNAEKTARFGRRARVRIAAQWCPRRACIRLNELPGFPALCRPSLGAPWVRTRVIFQDFIFLFWNKRNWRNCLW